MYSIIRKIGQDIKQFCLYVKALFCQLNDFDQMLLLSTAAIVNEILEFLVIRVHGDRGAVI